MRYSKLNRRVLYQFRFLRYGRNDIGLSRASVNDKSESSLSLLSSIILKYMLRTTAESVVVFVRARASGIVKCTTALYAVAKYCVELQSQYHCGII